MGTSTGSVAQLVAVIQRQLATPAAPPATAGATGAAARNRGAARGSRPAQRYARENLAALIELRVRQISGDDPQRGRKAFRVFLEAVLLSQFGAGLVNDPQFYQMVDDIQQALEADAGCQALVAQAIAQLLAD